MGSDRLRDVLDFILNGASDSEFEVIVKACERRRRDRVMFAGMGGMNPERLAGKLAREIETSMGADLGQVTTMAREYVERIIRREAPDATDEQVKVLLSMYLPTEAERLPPAESLPPDALLLMVKQFVAFSLDAMPPSEKQRLWEEMPRWQESYWKAFSPDLKALIQALLDGRIDEETFMTATLSVVGK
jgi:hypothetical protein